MNFHPHRAVVQCIKEKLASLRADNGANFTTNHAVVVGKFNVAWLAREYEQLYFVRAEDEFPKEHTGGSTDRIAEVYILGAHRLDEPQTSPWEGLIAAEQIACDAQELMAWDAEKVLLADAQLQACSAALGNAKVTNAQITDIGRGLWSVDGWAVIEYRLEVEYDTASGEP